VSANMSTFNAELQPASVDEAPNDVLDPADLPPKGATVRIKPYDPMKYKDNVTLFFYDREIDYIPIGQNAVGKDVTFTVTAQTLIENARENVVQVRYEVQFEGTGTPQKSMELALRLSIDFEAGVTLDLSNENYIAWVEKPPRVTPAFARMTREADWGTGPYAYTSSQESIATVDATTGEVTVRRNGLCTITATDSQLQARSFALTINGIHELHFLSPGADWDGMKRLCSAANLQPVRLPQIKRLWSLYYPSSGAVGDYFDWLNYPVWTADELGVETAWSYDLNGSHVNENASADDVGTMHQIIGIKQA